MPACPACGSANPQGQKFCGECGAKLQSGIERRERKVITALFCDLVGSTALGESMDHEEVSALLDRYQQLCRARIESHGGAIEKFIGDAVVGVFGVPTAHEDDPERAVRAALRIVTDVEASDLPIQVRIGINTGEALVRLDVDPRSGLGFATGDTLNTAARLEAAAPVMGVAVGEATYRASIAAIDYEELAPIQAKGKAEPVPAWRAMSPTSRVPDERDQAPFIGRALELSMLIDLFERSRSLPSTEFVTLVADPGLGKSRLVRELARHVEALPESVRWLVGRCLPYGDGISFWALGEIVKAEAGILETDDQDEIAERLTHAIVEPDEEVRAWMVDRLAPLVGLETATAAPDQQEVFSAWRRFLESMAATGPTVLVIEDLHWADAGTVAFLEHVAERTAGLPLLVVVTARPEIEEQHATWPPGRHSRVLSLRPLEDTDTRALVAACLPDATDELVAIVLERAGGSPLYAEQLASMLGERALPVAGAAIDETIIPAGVQALIAARIDGLATDAKRVLMEASVIGKTFWAGGIASLGEHAGLDGVLAELVRREFCRPRRPSTIEGDDEYGFWHVLVRDVAYAELTKADRARLHAGVARWMTGRMGLGEDAELVVHHLDVAIELAPPATELDTDELIERRADALVAAAAAAMRTDMPRAIHLLERCLEELPVSDGRARTTRGRLAEAFATTGDWPAARGMYQALFDELVADGRLTDAIGIAGNLASIFQALGETEGITALIDELRHHVGTAPSEAHVGLLVLECSDPSIVMRDSEVLARADAAVSMAADLGVDPPLEALEVRGQTRLRLGDRDGEDEVRAVVDSYVGEGRMRDALIALYSLGANLSFLAPMEGVSSFDRAIALAERIGADGEFWSSKGGRLSTIAWKGLGRFDAIVSEVQAIMPHVTGNDAFTECAAMETLALAERHLGGSLLDADRFIELLRRVRGPWALSEAAALAHARHEHRARALLQEALAASDWARDLLVPLCIDVGLPDLGVELLSRPVPGVTGAENARAVAEAAIAASRGAWADAADGYRRAASGWEMLGARLDQAEALQRLGQCLLELGERDNAVANLVEARNIWDSVAATLRVAEIDEMLLGVNRSQKLNGRTR